MLFRRKIVSGKFSMAIDVRCFNIVDLQRYREFTSYIERYVMVRQFILSRKVTISWYSAFVHGYIDAALIAGAWRTIESDDIEIYIKMHAVVIEYCVVSGKLLF